jgi:transposase
VPWTTTRSGPSGGRSRRTGDGYAKLLGVLGAPTDARVAMEATGHYWNNLFAELVGAGFAVALLKTTPGSRGQHPQEHG